MSKTTKPSSREAPRTGIPKVLWMPGMHTSGEKGPECTDTSQAREIQSQQTVLINKYMQWKYMYTYTNAQRAGLDIL